jgi:hypothetical protein
MVGKTEQSMQQAAVRNISNDLCHVRDTVIPFLSKTDVSDDFCVVGNRTQCGFSQRAYSRRNCVFVFREFLLSTYHEYLFSNSFSNVDEKPIVLDVAGGKGNLSWLLSNMDGIESVIIDPRLSSHSRLENSVKYLLDHPEEATNRSIKEKPTYQPLAEVILQKQHHNYSSSESNLTKTLRPKQVRIHVNENFLKVFRQKLLNTPRQLDVNEEIDEFTSTSIYTPWSQYLKDNIVHQVSTVPDPEKYKLNNTDHVGAGECVTDPDEIFDIIRRAKLIVGFHPDQATEPCMDLAQILKVPFAICPCCVFPKEFPNRTYQGEKVTKYDQFLGYLKAKYQCVNEKAIKVAQLHTLKATSRNVVLYTHPLSNSM